MKCQPRGDINSPVWFIVSDPTDKDFVEGRVLSSGLGFMFDKWLGEANLPTPYIVPFWDDPIIPVDVDVARNQLQALLSQHAPPLIIPLGKLACGTLLPETKARKQAKKSPKKNFDGEIEKWSGSLLTSPFLTYPHYCMPTYAPMFVVQNWWYKDLFVSLDLGKIKEELTWFQQFKSLQPLPIRELKTEPDYNELMGYLYQCRLAEYISVDIETIRPPKSKTTQFKGHCGYPYTISLAPSPQSGISFSFWDYTDFQSVKIWRELDWLLRDVPQIGQNYFGFDIFFLEAMGFRICKDKVQDTLIRHHILWPELEHKLQFLTKQYTRQPYYKDEGKNWSPKHKKTLMRYNALDTTVTYEVFLKQEEEFNDRPHLK